ncbi:hypothetical protein ACNKHV_20735 [Shigella flexneri]
MRAFTPWPMSWLEIEGQPVKSGKRRSLICRPTCTRNNPEANKQGIQVATGDGILTCSRYNLRVRKRCSAQDLLNSRRERFVPGNRLV